MQAERKFIASIVKAGGRTFVPLAFDPNDAWGPKGRHCLCGTIGGATWRGTVTAYGEARGLPVGPVWLRDNGINVGDEVEVAVRPEGPQSDALAEDLATAFEVNPESRAFFDSLTSFHRKNFMRWIDSAKRPETRSRRIAEMMAMLREGRLK